MLGMTGVAGCQAGIERMIGNCARAGVAIVLDMTIYTANTLLIVRGIRERHAMFFVTVNAEL